MAAEVRGGSAVLGAGVVSRAGQRYGDVLLLVLVPVWLHRKAVCSALKVDGHWIMLQLCPSPGRSVSLGVNGEWTGLDAGLLCDDWRVYERL